MANGVYVVLPEYGHEPFAAVPASPSSTLTVVPDSSPDRPLVFAHVAVDASHEPVARCASITTSWVLEVWTWL